MAHPLSLRLLIAASLASSALVAGCGGGGGGGGPSAPPPQRRDAYFTVNAKQQFVATRNLSGRTEEEITALLDKARDEGTTLVRFHVTHLGGLGMTSSGGVVEDWAAAWDRIFTHAEADGIQVVPVFAVWVDWNDGSDGEAWHVWDANPLNRINGGPASSPVELFQPRSTAQERWLGWLGRLVARWAQHENVAAWEVFSELDLVTHAGDFASFEPTVVAFFETAAARVRAKDPSRRPVTASASGGRWNWPALQRSAAMELVQIHLYGPEQALDEAILSAVGTLRNQGVTQPILLGESGLDWRAPDGGTLTTAVQAPVATRHAVWAALVSGAMNGRALWWEDGYAVLQNGDPALPFVADYPAVEAPALAVLAGQDLAGWQRLGTSMAGVGGVIGDEWGAIGWLRSYDCAAPSWDCATDVEVPPLMLNVPGSVLTWQASFFDAVTGAPLGGPVSVTRASASDPLDVQPPVFRDGVAFMLGAVVP